MIRRLILAQDVSSEKKKPSKFPMTNDACLLFTSSPTFPVFPAPPLPYTTLLFIFARRSFKLMGVEGSKYLVHFSLNTG
jgi:hypothetical protein